MTMQSLHRRTNGGATRLNTSHESPSSSSMDPSMMSRKRYTNWMPNAVRSHVVAASGEFTGTFLFLFFGLSATQVANTTIVGVPLSSDDVARGVTANPNQLLYIALSWGFSLAVNLWMFSGGLFNPAVSCFTFRILNSLV